MYKVIVERSSGKWELIDVNKFIDEYHITPTCQNSSFYLVNKQDRDYYINEFPNPACIFINGGINYIIYKGSVQMIVNGRRVPPMDLVPEGNAFASREAAEKFIMDYEEEQRGEMYIDTPRGRFKIDN